MKIVQSGNRQSKTERKAEKCKINEANNRRIIKFKGEKTKENRKILKDEKVI